MPADLTVVVGNKFTTTELGVPARASGSSGLPDHLITYYYYYYYMLLLLLLSGQALPGSVLNSRRCP